MPNRAQRRAAERKQTAVNADIAAQLRAAGPNLEPLPINLPPDIPESCAPHPSLESLTPRIVANRANAQHSTGPKKESFPITSQNRTTHGLARHNGAFKLIETEDPAAFEALKQSLIDEHQPSTPTESILVNSMAEYHWLANRAQRMQDDLMDHITGHFYDEKSAALYLRYQTTHTRNFHKSLNDLIKLRAAAHKEELGFEAQRIQAERHEMKKQHHYWDILFKDGKATHQLLLNRRQIFEASEQYIGFEAQCNADLAKRALQLDHLNGSVTPIPVSEVIEQAA